MRSVELKAAVTAASMAVKSVAPKAAKKDDKTVVTTAEMSVALRVVVLVAVLVDE